MDTNFDPILRLKNILLKQSLNVTPILYFADGTEYDLPALTLEPAGVAQVNIRLALENAPASIQARASSYGMAGISYQWSWPAVIASIQNTDEIASLTITSSLHADVRTTHAKPEVGAPQVIRGSWWLPTRNADSFLIIENSSLTEKSVAVQFSGHTGASIAKQTVQLPPHGSSMIHLSTALGASFGGETAGAVEIHYTGPESGVVAYAGITDETSGFSASPHLFEDHLDPARPVHQVTLSAPGLLLGNADPAMQFPSQTYFHPYAVLHNLSAQSRQVTLELTSAPVGGTPRDIPLEGVTLAPGQTTRLDLGSQFSQSNPLPNGYGHLSATFNGRDGDVQMETGSADQSGSYVFEVTPTQQVESGSRTLCFWSIEGDNDSMITVWNYKLTAQDLVLTLYYGGGKYRLPIHLEPRQAYNLDMLSLVRSRMPDPDGTLIPDNITSGSAMLSGPGGEADRISVAVSASVFNVRNATCGQQCTTCNGASEAAFNPVAYAMPVQGTQSAQFQITWNSGTVYTNPSGTSWYMQNTTIATVNSGGTITGQSPGQTLASAVTQTYPIYATVCSEGNAGPCPQAPLQGQGPTTVTPTITSVSPAQGLVGTGITVTIAGTGFAAGATVNAGSNISVTNVNVASSTQITATFTPSNSTSAGGNQGVTVMVSSQQSNSKNFFVQYPTHLVYTDEPMTPNNGHSTTVSGTNINIVAVNRNTIATGVCGGYQWLTYTPTDQNGTPISNGTITFTESFSNFSPSPDPFSVPTPNSGTIGLPGGYLGDTQALWGLNPPTCLPASKSDSFNQGFSSTVGSVTYPITTVVTVGRSSNSQGLPSFNVSITTP